MRKLGVNEDLVQPWPDERYGSPHYSISDCSIKGSFDLIWTLYANGTFVSSEEDCPYLDYLDENGNPVDRPSMLVQGSDVRLLH